MQRAGAGAGFDHLFCVTVARNWASSSGKLAVYSSFTMHMYSGLAFYSGNFQENTWDNWTIIEDTGSDYKTIAFSLFTRETQRYLNPL